MEMIDVIRKLIGPIIPVGESRADAQRFVNLVETIDIVDKLLVDIGRVSASKGRPEASMNKAGEHAMNFLEALKDY
ncbi:hypothetical protein KAR91_46090 [Candidatus Pacearchaeota archaeon]|nr:hypothetical protein [Candidatus Pacearchaeota archaeon]